MVGDGTLECFFAIYDVGHPGRRQSLQAVLRLEAHQKQ